MQYPELKKIKKLCSAYIKKFPTFYDNKDNPKIINSEEYKVMTKDLMKKAREVLGKEEKFTVKIVFNSLAGNATQGKEVTFDLIVMAEQYVPAETTV